METFALPRIAIIGGGLAGASAAWALSKRGAEVTIYERADIASGASGAAVGALQPLPGMRLSAREENLRGFRRTLSLLDELLVRDRTWRQTGVLRLTCADEQRGFWEERFTQLPEGLATWLEGDALRAIEPRLRDNVLAGVLIPEAAIVDIPAFVRALIDVSRAQVFDNTRVLAAEDGADGITLTLQGGCRTTFDYVVVASGAQAPDPLADADIELAPYMGILAAFTGLEPPAVAINHRGYIAGWRDNSVLVGTIDRRPPYADEPTEDSVRELRERLDTILDYEGEARLVRVWKGIRPAMADHTPLLRPSRAMPRAWYLTGFGGRGLLLGPMLAESLAEQMLG